MVDVLFLAVEVGKCGSRLQLPLLPSLHKILGKTSLLYDSESLDLDVMLRYGKSFSLWKTRIFDQDPYKGITMKNQRNR